jgi:hypothetical protein
MSPCLFAQEARDLTSQSIVFQQIAHGAGVIKKCLLQLCRQRIPLHNQRRPQASQDMLLFRRQSCFAGPTGLWQRHWLVKIIGEFVVIIGEPLLVVGEPGEALLVLLKFAHFVGSICSFR